jgi:drug/metabolite transporter (DMT)-like permease
MAAPVRVTARGAGSERLVGIALVVISAVGFGTLGVLARIADDEGADQVAVLVLRFGIAALVFAGVRVVRRRPAPRGRALLGLIVMGVLYAVQGACFFASVERGSPGLAALLLYAYPALVVLLGSVVLGQRPRRGVVLATAAALAGTAMIIGPTVADGNPAAIAFGLSTALTYSTYILIGSRVVERVDPIWSSVVIMGAAAVVTILHYAISSPTPRGPETGEAWAAVRALAIVSTVITVSTFLAGLARIGPADASTLSALEPATSVLLSAAVIGESLTGWTLAGGALVIAAVVAIGRLGAPVDLAEPAPAA